MGSGDTESQATQAREPVVGRQKFKFYQKPVWAVTRPQECPNIIRMLRSGVPGQCTLLIIANKRFVSELDWFSFHEHCEEKERKY